jgi:hypothetical protein
LVGDSSPEEREIAGLDLDDASRVEVAKRSPLEWDIDLHIGMGVRVRHAGNVLPPQDKPSMRGLVENWGECLQESDDSRQNHVFSTGHSTERKLKVKVLKLKN